MELENVLKRFAEMCALPLGEARRYEDLCAGAMAQTEAQRNGVPGGLDALTDYAAALAARQFVLRCLSTGGVVAIGEPQAGKTGALAAAEALEMDHRRAASRWLRPQALCFRQVPWPEEKPVEPENPGEEAE